MEGTHSEHRAQERRAGGGGGGGGGKQNQMKMERLEDEAREKQKELDRTRQQLLRVSGGLIFPFFHLKPLRTDLINFIELSYQAKEEIDNEKIRAEAAASVLAKKTKAMQEQVFNQDQYVCSGHRLLRLVTHIQFAFSRLLC